MTIGPERPLSETLTSRRAGRVSDRSSPVAHATGSPKSDGFLGALRLRLLDRDFIGRRHDFTLFPIGVRKRDLYLATTHFCRGSHGAVIGVHSSAAKHGSRLGPLLESQLDHGRGF